MATLERWDAVTRKVSALQDKEVAREFRIAGIAGIGRWILAAKNVISLVRSLEEEWGF